MGGVKFDDRRLRYLRVPSIPCTGSSADSVLSSSSGHLLGSSVPPTPGTMSSASSVEDVGAISEEFRKCLFYFEFLSILKYIYIGNKRSACVYITTLN